MIIKNIGLIILAAIAVLFQAVWVGKIAILGAKPNFILVLLILVGFAAAETQKQKKQNFFSSKKIFNGLDASWQPFFAVAAISGFLLDIANLDKISGFYFLSFLIIGAAIYLFFQKTPFKNIFFQLTFLSPAATILFNSIIGQEISYVFSPVHLIEIAYNTALVILIWGIINLRNIIRPLAK